MYCPHKLGQFKHKQRSWEPFRSKHRLTIAIIVVAGLLLFSWIWPLISRFIPPKHYSGVELYASGEYLEFEKGALFGQQISQLPFAENGQVVSFEYYDFWVRDAVFKNDPFADVYILQMELGGNYEAARQYLKKSAYEIHCSADGQHSRYYMGCPAESDYFFIFVNDQRQELFCILMTDSTTWANVDIFLAKNLGWIPGK